MIDKAFLDGIGITDADAAKKIVDAYKEDLQAQKQAADAVKDDLAEANKTIQSYKDMDIDGIKKSVDEYKQKYEQSEKDRQSFEYNTKLTNYVKSLNLKDEIYCKYVSDMLKEKECKFDGDKLIGADEYVNAFKEKHADAFAPNTSERTAIPTGRNKQTTLSGVEAAFYAKNPDITPDKN